MGKYNEINIGRWNRFLQKVTGIKGAAVAPQLAGDIQPIISMFSGIEHRYLESWDRFGFTLTATSGAAQTAGIRFRMPSVSNTIAVFEKLTAYESLADTSLFLNHGAVNADLATVLAPTFLRFDPRGRNQSSIIISRDVNVSVIGTAKHAVAVGANVPYDYMQNEDQEITVLPGDCLQILANTANDTLTVSAWWRERFLEDSERT